MKIYSRTSCRPSFTDRIESFGLIYSDMWYYELWLYCQVFSAFQIALFITPLHTTSLIDFSGDGRLLGYPNMIGSEIEHVIIVVHPIVVVIEKKNSNKFNHGMHDFLKSSKEGSKGTKSLLFTQFVGLLTM